MLDMLRHVLADDLAALPPPDGSIGTDALRLHHLMWHRAMQQWAAGEPEHVASLLRRGEPLPPFVAAWLAGVVDGSVRRQRGKPRRVPSLVDAIVELGVLSLYQLRHDEYRQAACGMRDGSPSERAISDTAAKFGLSESAVSRIVFPRRDGQ